MARPKVPGLLEQVRVIAILRRVDPTLAIETAAAVLAGGISTIEVTFDSPEVVEMLGALRDTFGNRIALGAGTVLSAREADLAIEAGAGFIVSPHTHPPMIAALAERGIPCIPGAFTASEVAAAWDANATLVKLFPAGSVGPDYLKDLRGPFRNIPFMVTGGITLANAASFFSAGAWGVGVGSAIVDPSLVRERKFPELTERARWFVDIAGDRVRL
jgi:2-dehydro-3-deoxyphosphogluconate aldolase/(4S)-4-hydroxy-2-oxoglutarate aldolase